MEKKQLLAILCVGFLSTSVVQSTSAQQPLKEFLEAAKTNALQLRRADASRKEAKATTHTAIGGLLPGVTGTGVYSRNQYEVRFQLPTGTGTAGQDVVIQRKDQWVGKAEVKMPLLDLTAWARYFEAKSLADAAKFNIALAELNTQLDVVNNWYLLVATKQLVKAAENNWEVTKQNREQVKIRVDAGATAELELARAYAEEARAEKTIADAKLQRDLAARKLYDLTFLEIADVEAELAIQYPAPLELSTLLDDVSNTPSVKVAAARRRASKAAKRSSIYALLPAIYGSFTEQITNASGFSPKSQWVAAVTGIWTLDYSRGANVAAKKAASTGAAIDAELAAQQVRTAIFEAWHRVRSAESQLKSTEVSLKASTRAAHDARLRYEAGAGTQLDQIQADRDRFAAEADRIEAIGNLAVAHAALRLQAGIPLGEMLDSSVGSNDQAIEGSSPSATAPSDSETDAASAE
ncbi:MAG: TolC family protein [Polyangiales bacterium]